MGIDSGFYKVLYVGHILTVMVGLGPMMLNGVYASISRRQSGPAGLAVFDANYEVSTKWAQKAIYAIPIFGFALMGASDGAFEMDQTWIWLSLVVYVVAMGISHGIVTPTARRMGELMRELAAGPPAGGAGAPAGPPPQVAQLEALGKKMGPAAGSLHLLTLVLLVLMTWKPGL